jgi:hypothetical protein
LWLPTTDYTDGEINIIKIYITLARHRLKGKHVGILISLFKISLARTHSAFLTLSTTIPSLSQQHLRTQGTTWQQDLHCILDSFNRNLIFRGSK